MPFWGFNYSKMAKTWFLIDSSTFWMILGTSKILSKSGPVALPIIIKLLEKYKKILEHPWNIWILEIWESENLKIFESSVYQIPSVFLWTFGSFFLFLIFWFYNLIIWWNDEKSKTRNFLRCILPAEFLEKLGYEFSFDEKPETKNVG